MPVVPPSVTERGLGKAVEPHKDGGRYTHTRARSPTWRPRRDFSLVVSGSCMERGTESGAARWITQATPFLAGAS